MPLTPSSSDSTFHWNFLDPSRSQPQHKSRLRYRKLTDDSDEGIACVCDANKLNKLAKIFLWKEVAVTINGKKEHVFINKSSFKKRTKQDLKNILDNAKNDNTFKKKWFESDLSRFFRYIDHQISKAKPEIPTAVSTSPPPQRPSSTEDATDHLSSSTSSSNVSECEEDAFWSEPVANRKPLENSTVKVPPEAKEKYGNKAFHLMELDLLCKELHEQGVPVQVPPFYPLSHDDIHQHIIHHYPRYLEDWQEFASLQGDNSTLKPKSKEKLEIIQKKIKDVFNNHPLDTNLFANFLHGLESNNTLMVRSTGKEDTQALANAGGNISEAGVPPDPIEISKAIGNVVASYHSELSLSQRLLANDDITSQPFTPVLLQQMIGENPEQARSEMRPPVAGVVYTTELLGHTDSLTQIQATFGHNEAVVNSQLPVDTYYAYPNGEHHDIVRPKEQRLIADPQGGFQLKPNPQAFVHRPALTSQQIQRLQIISKMIHNFYRQTTDIEWVYDPNKEMFSIVQARPLVARTHMDPSIVDTERLEELAQGNVNMHPGEPIVAHDGAVTLLTDRSEIIADTSLERAFHRYLDMAQDKEKSDKIKAVIITGAVQSDAATSHFASTLRENGVAVFACPDFDFQQLDATNQLSLIDPQQGMLFLIKNSNLPREKEELIQALEGQQILKKGWYRHPIPAIESVQPGVIADDTVVRQIYDTLFLLSEATNSLEKRKITTSKELKQALSELSSSDPSTAKQAIQDLSFWCYQCLHRHINENTETAEKAKALLRNIATIGKRIAEEGTPHMQRLHAAKRIEALLMQQSSALVINSNSLYQVLAEQQQLDRVQLATMPLNEHEKTTLKVIENREWQRLTNAHMAPETIDQLKRPLSEEEQRVAQAVYETASKVILSPTIKENWKSFSEKIAASGSRLANRMLLDLIHNMQDLQVFETWIHFSFDQAWKTISPSGDNVIDLLQKLKLDLDAPKSQKILNEVSEAQKRLKHQKEIEGQWADPSRFEALNRDLEHGLIQDVKTLSETLDRIEPSDVLLRNVIMHFLVEAVDTYDKAIKTIYTSAEYPKESSLKVEHFKTMLDNYRQIMEMWIRKIPDATIKNWSSIFTSDIGAADLAGFSPGEDLREKIIEVITSQYDSKSENDLKQLQPSAGFNVNASAINSGNLACLRLNKQITLHDLFTLIHQNILASFMACEPISWGTYLTEEIKHLHQTLLEKTKTINFGRDKIHLKINLLGGSYEYPQIKLKYNVPIKNHSAVIDLTYDQKTNNTTLAVRVLAHNMSDRMKWITEKITAQSLFLGLPLEEIPHYENSQQMLHFAWSFTNDDWHPDKQVTSKIADIFFESLQDTLSGLWGATPTINFRTFMRGDINFWRQFLSSPESVNDWSKQEFPFLTELWRFLKHNDKKIKEELTTIFLTTCGTLSPDDQDKTMSEKLILALEKNKYRLSGDINKYGSALETNEFSRWLLETINKDQECCQLLINNPEAWLSREGDSDQYQKFCTVLAKTLISKTEDEERISLFVDKLIESRQYKTLAYLSSENDLHPAVSDKQTQINEALKGQVVEGYPVEDEIVERHGKEINNFLELTPGDLVVRKASDGSWKSAKVLKVEDGQAILSTMGTVKVGVTDTTKVRKMNDIHCF